MVELRTVEVGSRGVQSGLGDVLSSHVKAVL